MNSFDYVEPTLENALAALVRSGKALARMTPSIVWHEGELAWDCCRHRYDTRTESHAPNCAWLSAITAMEITGVKP